MRAALYARFSSINQREESITAQLRASAEYCKSKGYTIVREYADEATSGTSVAGREEFQKMVLESADNIFDVVIFHKIDRAARNEIDYYANISRLQKNGIGYEYSAEGIDVTTANGKLTEGIKVAVAAWYSRNLSMEIKKGKKETALQGKHNGGKPPLGYDVVDGKYVVNEEEAYIVRSIYELKADGFGYGKIIDWLNERGYRTKRGNSFGKNSLNSILTNRKYIGVYELGRTDKHNSHVVRPDMLEIEGAVPRIISEELYERVAKRMEKSAKGRTHATVTYYLSGKIRCACGGIMTGQYCGHKDNKYYYYVCRNRFYKRTDCDVPRLRKDIVEKAVLEYAISEVRGNKNFIISQFSQEDTDSEVKEKSAAITAQIKKLQRKQDNLMDLYADTGDRDIADKYKAVKAQIAALKKENAAIQKNNSVSFALVQKFLKKFEQETFDEDDIRKIFETLIESVVVHKDHIDIKLTLKIDTRLVALKSVVTEPHITLTE